MTEEARTEWQDPVFVIELPVGGFIEPIKGNTIYLYRDIEPQQNFDMQEALYAITAPPGYVIECDENQRWRHAPTGE